MSYQWTKERIWEWYDARPWIRGCNYMPSDAISNIDMWQGLHFEERFETAKAELRLAADTGFNAIRIFLSYIVWKEEHDSFMERFERFLTLMDSFGIQAVVCLGDDCQVPRDNPYSREHCGEQKFEWGYHGGRKNSQHSTRNDEPGYWLIDDEPELVYSWVQEIIGRYKDDNRILIWDLYNEPGNCKREQLTIPHLKRFFEIAREIDPIQPLTAGVWTISEKEEELYEVEQFALEHSDIVSYHKYSPYMINVQVIRKLKKYGRPIINTEWLGRVLGNSLEENFPLFYVEKIGCFNWGFVAGKYQGHEPWNTTWEQYYDGIETNVDFTKWFHDLYRSNFRPYNPKEIEIIRTLTAAADKEFEETKI